MILQLFIFALLFAGFGIYSLLRKKKLIAIMFILLGVFLFIVALAVVLVYPDTLPF